MNDVVTHLNQTSCMHAWSLDTATAVSLLRSFHLIVKADIFATSTRERALKIP
jgi:hypothetical protein